MQDNAHRDLVTVTQELLRERPVTLTFAKIAEDTDNAERFIASLARNESTDYAARKVQRVYEYLTKKPLLAG